jgi:hypothetical protein
VSHIANFTIQENAKCISKSDLSHDRLSLCPVTRFQQDELRELIERMTLDAKGELPRSAAAASFISMRLTWALASKARNIVKRMLPPKPPGTVIKTLKNSDFLHDWSRGLPVVIANMLLQGTWDPQYFIDAFGEEGATIVNCETGQTKKVCVKEYFGWFLNPDERTGIWKLKVSCP